MVRSNATDRLRLGRVVTGVLWVAGWSLLVAVGPPSGITYIYDENGRLAAVEDPSQGTAVYVYDAAGNVTAISQYAPTKVLVLSFSPSCAPAPASGQGPAVTINGTGFDTTAKVTFSASGGGTVSAPASSVTYSQLVTSVPVGAITGAVTVTVGSDSSGKNFTVGCGAP